MFKAGGNPFDWSNFHSIRHQQITSQSDAREKLETWPSQIRHGGIFLTYCYRMLYKEAPLATVPSAQVLSKSRTPR